jgi:hypothetical protein
MVRQYSSGNIMKKQDLVWLAKSFRDKLLGDIVITALGKDLDIERIMPPQQATLAGSVFTNFLKHSTVARIGEDVVGTAKTYWQGPHTHWVALRQERMLQVLHRTGATFCDYRYTPVEGIMQRAIGVEVANSLLYIREQIFLAKLARLIS